MYKKEENYYKPVRVNSSWNNNYIEYKSSGDKNKLLSVEEYLNKIRAYLRGLVNDLKQSDTWEIQLTIAINFISCKEDYDEDRVMLSKSDSIEPMSSDETYEVIKKFVDSLKNGYQNNLESMRGSEFVYDYVKLLDNKCHKTNFNHVAWHIDSLDWIKNNKATINSVNKNDNNCFQYAAKLWRNEKNMHKK